jgi:tetratricopeptide (TPR) repeat protein
MAKAILTVTLIVLLNVLAGCAGEADRSSAKLMVIRDKQTAGPAAVIKIAEAGETDVVEQVTASRQAYRNGLEQLIDYYTQTGNNMKVKWAKKELAELDGMAQYNYIVEASLAGPDLRATDAIREADRVFVEGITLENEARGLMVIVDEDKLRRAVDKYNEVIRFYPTSDRIGDAAYNAAGIYEHFRDYTVAALYYQRVYQWDPATRHPAMFKAAYILDRKLHRMAEALEIYKEALKDEDLSYTYKEFVQMRIAEITKSGKEVE